jgi:hypothetical protein
MPIRRYRWRLKLAAMRIFSKAIVGFSSEKTVGLRIYSSVVTLSDSCETESLLSNLWNHARTACLVEHFHIRRRKKAAGPM